MTAITLYLKAMPCIPVRGVRDDDGAIRVGAAGGWEFSRPLMAHEIERTEEPKASFFSFRAECVEDVVRFIAVCRNTGLTIHPTKAYTLGKGIPDVAVEFEANTDFYVFGNVLRDVVDGHVMLQTLRQCRLDVNSLERNYDVI